MKCQRSVVRQGPRRSRPNDGAHVAHSRKLALSAASHSKLNPNRRARMIFVLDLGFSQRCRIVNAPINRLAPAIRVTFLHEIEQRASNNGLVVVVRREIGFIPTPKNSQSLEIPLVLRHIARRKLPAKTAKLRRRNFSLTAEFLFHLRLDRQSMAVPTRHVRRVMA